MIVIGVPVDKNFTIDVRTAAYCSSEAALHGKWGYARSRDAGVGRDTIAYYSLKNSEMTHVYYVDSDVQPPPGTLQKLIDYDLPVVAGIYRMFVGEELRWSFKKNEKDDWWKVDKPLPEHPVNVSTIGGSTVLVKREVFEAIEKPWFLMQYRAIDEKGMSFDYGEDEYFSRKVIAAGYDIVIDPTLVCNHSNYRSL